MKLCPRCEEEHEKPGIYCSRKCANVRVWSEETQRKRIKSCKIAYKKRSAKRKKEISLAGQVTRMKKTLEKDFDSLHYDNKRFRVILDQDGKCARCNLDTWMGSSLRLELEHKDGNHDNNARSNLEALCPNCHSLTPHWRGKSTGRQWNKVLRLLKYKRLYFKKM